MSRENRKQQDDGEDSEGTVKINAPTSSSEAQTDSVPDSLLLSTASSTSMPNQHVQSFRVFVSTWNAGGKSPHANLNLDGFLQVDSEFDIYVLGFQEIVRLNAGNVLVVEDNEPAAKWLALINQSLNKSSAVSLKVLKSNSSFGAGSVFFPKPSLKQISESFRTDCGRRLKTCSCSPDFERKHRKESCLRYKRSSVNQGALSSDDDEDGLNNEAGSGVASIASNRVMKYSLVASKQMVGIFLTVWMRKELVQHVSHLRISCVTRGIMGCLGNKGCISVSMSFFKTTFCFICGHLASGEKEGDELRRNSDVVETLKNTMFPRICRTPYSCVPEKILQHDRVVWLGDLNYRIALSYSETRKLLEKNDWDALLHKDQLKIERDAGRVFRGWNEGKIYFAPTYKYSFNSDTYAGETIKEKNKRRTPAWCDRILWHGNGIRQLSYVRSELRFSDHRPVCAAFVVDVDVCEGEI